MNLNNIQSIEYSVQNVADRLGIPYDQILRHLRKGYIRGSKRGRAWSIPDEEVMQILAGKNEAIMKSLAPDNTPFLETFDYGYSVEQNQATYAMLNHTTNIPKSRFF